MTKRYELTVLLNPSLSSEKQQKAQDEVAKLIASRGGSVEKTEVWGRKVLAYPIGKYSDAVYVLYTLVMDTTKAQELARNVQLNDAVIRHLLVVSEEKQAEKERGQAGRRKK